MGKVVAETKADGALTGNAFTLVLQQRASDIFTRYTLFDDWKAFTNKLKSQERDTALPVDHTRGKNKLFKS